MGQIIVIGDPNSRLSKKVESLSYFDSSTDEENFQDIVIPGKNFQDGISNTSGNKMIRILNENTMVTLNGRKIGDTLGRFTCHQYNGSSTVDLAITSWDLFHKIQYFKVNKPVWFSDHCPIQLSIEADQFCITREVDKSQFLELHDSFIWTEEGATKFSSLLESQNIQDRFYHEVLSKIELGQVDCSTASQNFEKILIDVAQNTLPKKLDIVTKNSSSSYCNKWMNGSCFQAEKNFIKNKKEFLRSPDNLDRQLKFLNAKKKCKKYIILLKRHLKKKIYLRFLNLLRKNPKCSGVLLNLCLGIHLTKNRTVYIQTLGNHTSGHFLTMLT